MSRTLVIMILIISVVLLIPNHGLLSAEDSEGFTVVDGVPYKDGEPLVIFGVAWFGFETQSFVPHGLWARDWKSLLKQIKDLGFNAIRLPFCASTLHGAKPNPDDINYDLNPDLRNKTSLEIMDMIIHEAYKIGLLVLLDYHRIGCEYIEEVWYNDTYPEEKVIADWVFLAERYKNYTNIIGADIKNEPHGKASWGTGDNTTDIRLFAERVGKAILDVAPRWLIFVEGVERTHVSTIDNSNPYPCYWGENLMGVKEFPVRLPKNKVVYTPHVYGPSVYNQTYFQSEDFPESMPKIWDLHFGYIHKEKLGTLAIGEWGGWYTGLDKIWQDKFAEYIIERKIFISFYWSLNPNSGDTGGVLLNDWETPNQEKLDMLHSLLQKMKDNLPNTQLQVEQTILLILLIIISAIIAALVIRKRNK